MARELVAELRRLRATGVDPLDKRRSERAVQRVEAAKAMTFDQCAEVYVEAHEQSWSQKHHYDWCRTLRLASQIVGKLPVREIDTSLILKCVEPIWTTKNETASRLRNRIEHILDWAKVRGYRDGENPARWRGHLDHILPRPSKIQKIQHLAAVPYVEMPAFMADLRTRQDIRARCLEFTILTAVRTREATGARWSEIDLRPACG